MIVPRSKLLFWVAAVVLPFSIIGAMGQAGFAVAAAVVGGFFVLAAVDAILAGRTLAGISCQVPEVVRLSKDRPGNLEVKIQNTLQKARQLRLGLALPEGLTSPHEELLITLRAGTEWSRLEWPCRAVRRGLFRLTRIYLEAGSPMGLWSFRASASIHAELRVYPNLFADRKNLAALFLNRGTFGLHAQRQVGKGREFEKLREYIPGDSFDEIHWKATAKRACPVTKMYQIERTQEIYVVIDASRLSARLAGASAATQIIPSAGARQPGSTKDPEAPVVQPVFGGQGNSQSETQSVTTLERYVTAALLLGLAARQQGDLFGLITFSDKVGKFLRAQGGKGHFQTCRDALYLLEPAFVEPDYEEVASFLRLRLRRRALLVFLTALDDPALAESFVRSMDLLCRQHLVLVNMLQPVGIAPLFSSPDVSRTEDLYDRLAGHLQWQDLRELERVLQRRGVRFSVLEHEKLSTQLVSQYLSVKRRQVL